MSRRVVPHGTVALHLFKLVCDVICNDTEWAKCGFEAKKCVVNKYRPLVVNLRKRKLTNKRRFSWRNFAFERR